MSPVSKSHLHMPFPLSVFLALPNALQAFPGDDDHDKGRDQDWTTAGSPLARGQSYSGSVRRITSPHSVLVHACNPRAGRLKLDYLANARPVRSTG